MKKSILLLFAALLPLVASAYHDLEVDGIYYNITSEADKQVEVTYKGHYYDSYTNEYSSSITLPATVTHNGVAYSVTSIGSGAFYGCTDWNFAFIGNSSVLGYTCPKDAIIKSALLQIGRMNHLGGKW